eukprot:NODE_47_length_32105_cov_1.240892.p24 type:complete len:158 gc:universal NODE_47_length_32105_cov_1.240892:6150-6623(+)
MLWMTFIYAIPTVDMSDLIVTNQESIRKLFGKLKKLGQPISKITTEMLSQSVDPNFENYELILFDSVPKKIWTELEKQRKIGQEKELIASIKSPVETIPPKGRFSLDPGALERLSSLSAEDQIQNDFEPRQLFESSASKGSSSKVEPHPDGISETIF